MAVAIGGGWLALHLTGSLPLMFAAVGAALVVYGAGVGTAVWMRRLVSRRSRTPRGARVVERRTYFPMCLSKNAVISANVALVSGAVSSRR